MNTSLAGSSFTHRLVSLLACLIPIAGNAASLTWTNTAGGNWNAAANWSPNAVPGAPDTANITTPGTYTVTLNANATIAALNLGAASGTQTLDMSANTLAPTAGAVNANGVLAMSGGSLEGKLTVQSGGVLSFLTTGPKALYSLTLVNQGTVNWAGGLLYHGSTPTTIITNAAAAFRSSRGDEAQTSSSQPSTLNSQPNSQSLLTSAATNDRVGKLLALLKHRHSNAVTETTWQLAARPAETSAPAADEIEIKKRFGPNAQILSFPPGDGKERKFYFADLPGELQNVLRVQLRRPGDVSAVIETPGGLLLYVAKEKTDVVLTVAGLSLPKRSYEQWLEEQAKGEPRQ